MIKMILLIMALLYILVLIVAFPPSERLINTDTITDPVVLPIGDLH